MRARARQNGVAVADVVGSNRVHRRRFSNVVILLRIRSTFRRTILSDVDGTPVVDRPDN